MAKTFIPVHKEFLSRDKKKNAFWHTYVEKVVPYVNARITVKTFEHNGAALASMSLLAAKERAAVVFVHGKSESFLKYAELFYDLRDANISFYAFDCRGQGLSSRSGVKKEDRVYVKKFNDYVDDLNYYIERVVMPSRGKNATNLILMAHSMGGGIVANYLERYPDAPVQKAIFISPMLSPFLPFPASLTRALTGALKTIGFGKALAPTQKPYRAIAYEENTVTSSRERHEMWHDYIVASFPKTKSDGATVNWLYQSLSALKTVTEDAAKINTPALVIYAGKDVWVDTKEIKRFVKRLPRARTLYFANAKHEILMETDAMRNEALKAIRAFIAEKIVLAKSASQPGKKPVKKPSGAKKRALGAKKKSVAVKKKSVTAKKSAGGKKKATTKKTVKKAAKKAAKRITTRKRTAKKRS